jgi:hypothetical protein
MKHFLRGDEKIFIVEIKNFKKEMKIYFNWMKLFSSEMKI